MLYPPSLLYLILPLTWSLSFFCLAHLFWGGLGMYLLARHWTRHRLASGLAGVIFAFNGLALNFLMWPSHVATFSWLPWVLWLAPQGWREGGRKLVWAALAGAMQMLAGGPETIIFTWFILCLLAGGDWLRFRRNLNLNLRTPLPQTHQPRDPSLSPERGEGAVPRSGSGDQAAASLTKCLDPNPNLPAESPGQITTKITTQATRWVIPMRFGGLALLVALVCAAQLLPFLELLARSQRDSAYGSATHNWAMPFWGWANLLVPLFRTSPGAQGIFFQNGQYWTSSYYAGIGTVWLSLIALRRARDWRVGLLAILIFLGLVLAWGDASALFCGLRACLPALGFVRYPVKFVILAVALAPLLAAFGLMALADRLRRLGRFEWGCGLALLALVVSPDLGFFSCTPADLVENDDQVCA